MKEVMDLYAEGEVADGNPRKLAIAFDGTLFEAAIGEHEMFHVPSYNITRDEWGCWNWTNGNGKEQKLVFAQIIQKQKMELCGVYKTMLNLWSKNFGGRHTSTGMRTPNASQASCPAAKHQSMLTAPLLPLPRS